MQTGDRVAEDQVIDIYSVDFDGLDVLVLYDLVGGRTGMQSFTIGAPPTEHPIRVAD